MHTQAQQLMQTAASHLEKGDYAHAEALLRTVATQASSMEPLLFLGDVLCIQAKFDEAVDFYRQATQLFPEHVEPWEFLGDALVEMEHFPEAQEAFLQASSKTPAPLPDLLMKLGRCAFTLDAVDSAIHYFQQVVAIDPTQGEAQLNLGSLFLHCERFEEAQEAFLKATQLEPSAEAFVGLGNSLRRLKHLTDAVEAYQGAIRCDPQHIDALNFLGVTLKELGRREEALQSFERAVKQAPTQAEGWNNLTQLRLELCEWGEHDAHIQQLTSLIEDSLNKKDKCPITPFLSLSLPLSQELQRRIAVNYAERMMPKGVQKRVSPELLQLYKEGKQPKCLHIGYLSSDYHNHPVAHLICGLFAAHNREAVKVSVYSFGGEDQSVYRRRIEEGADAFIDITALSDQDAAQRIADDKVHVLVDLKGYTLNHRPGIFAYRPAPIHMNWLGYPGTLGSTAYDYIIGDATVTPHAHRAFYSEKIAQMPHCYQVNDSLQEIASHTPSRVEQGLPEKGFVYCCFNQNYKFEPEMFSIWMQILQAVPDSVLWMLRYSPDCVSRLQKEAEKRGIDTKRLVFGDRVNKSAHLARHQHADLFLDTKTYNAHTTASDSLYAGLPLISCPGESFASRVAASLLKTVGMPELICPELDQYRSLAIRLGQNPEEVKGLKVRLKALKAHSPLFDTKRFATDLETLYQSCWASGHTEHN